MGSVPDLRIYKTDMARQKISIGARKFSVWPSQQVIQERGSPGIQSTRFEDCEDFHSRLIDWLLEQEGKQDKSTYFFRGACGTKIRDIHRWPVPEARLLQTRAEHLFRRVTGRETVYTDSNWANIYRSGDYCMPHSHLRAAASIVYMLDTGDPQPEDPHAGQFCIVDPRVGCCCQEEDERMTTPFTPAMSRGTMLIFPAQIVHSVNPYNGRRPRLTLAWNLNDRPIAGSQPWEEAGDDLRAST